jgi:hypothetical protein
MLTVNAFMDPAEIEADDHPDVFCMTFFDNVGKHFRLHIRIGILKRKLCGVKGHDAAGIDDHGICGMGHQVGYQRICMQRRGFIRREINLDYTKVIPLPPWLALGVDIV